MDERTYKELAEKTAGNLTAEEAYSLALRLSARDYARGCLAREGIEDEEAVEHLLDLDVGLMPTFARRAELSTALRMEIEDAAERAVGKTHVPVRASIELGRYDDYLGWIEEDTIWFDCSRALDQIDIWDLPTYPMGFHDRDACDTGEAVAHAAEELGLVDCTDRVKFYIEDEDAYLRYMADRREKVGLPVGKYIPVEARLRLTEIRDGLPVKVFDGYEDKDYFDISPALDELKVSDLPSDADGVYDEVHDRLLEIVDRMGLVKPWFSPHEIIGETGCVDVEFLPGKLVNDKEHTCSVEIDVDQYDEYLSLRRDREKCDVAHEDGR